MTRPSTLALVLAAGLAHPAAAVQYKQDTQYHTTAVWDLVPAAKGYDCGAQQFTGTVVQRSFAPDGLTPDGFVLEAADGTRQFINVWVDLSNGRVERSVVLDGLQRLLRVGRLVVGRVQVCGSGPILTLEAVQ